MITPVMITFLPVFHIIIVTIKCTIIIIMIKLLYDSDIAII